MRGTTGIIAAAGLVAVLATADAPEARAQGAIGFQPNVSPFNDGVILNATPAVSADRRYVRLGMNANFSAINGVQPFTFNAGAVSGGGVGGGFGGLNGLGGIGNAGGLGAVGGGGLGGSTAIVPGLGAVGPVNGFYGGFGYPAYYGGYYPYGYPGAVYAGIPAGPLYTGPGFVPQQTVNGLGSLGGSIMNSVAPGSWNRTRR